jgi:alpha-glucosidase
MVKLRMRLLPYLYGLFEECHRNGAPILRPLLFEYPGDPTTYAADDEFLLGDALLVAPIARPGIEHRHVYLPEGTWFHLWTGERFDGPAHVLAHAPLGEPAIYIKANAAIPTWPEMSHVGERPADPLTLLLYPVEGSGEAVFYEDAGDGFGYENGEYARRKISCETTGERVTVRLSSARARSSRSASASCWSWRRHPCAARRHRQQRGGGLEPRGRRALGKAGRERG